MKLFSKTGDYLSKTELNEKMKENKLISKNFRKNAINALQYELEKIPSPAAFFDQQARMRSKYPNLGMKLANFAMKFIPEDSVKVKWGMKSNYFAGIVRDKMKIINFILNSEESSNKKEIESLLEKYDSALKEPEAHIKLFSEQIEIIRQGRSGISDLSKQEETIKTITAKINGCKESVKKILADFDNIVENNIIKKIDDVSPSISPKI